MFGFTERDRMEWNMIELKELPLIRLLKIG